MPRLTFKSHFTFAVDGVRVVHYEPGETAEVNDRCAELALAAGIAAPAEEGASAPLKPASTKAHLKAPQQKAPR
jgi:hypothetical protein